MPESSFSTFRSQSIRQWRPTAAYRATPLPQRFKTLYLMHYSLTETSKQTVCYFLTKFCTRRCMNNSHIQNSVWRLSLGWFTQGWCPQVSGFISPSSLPELSPPIIGLIWVVFARRSPSQPPRAGAGVGLTLWLYGALLWSRVPFEDAPPPRSAPGDRPVWSIDWSSLVVPGVPLCNGETKIHKVTRGWDTGSSWGKRTCCSLGELLVWERNTSKWPLVD